MQHKPLVLSAEANWPVGRCEVRRGPSQWAPMNCLPRILLPTLALLACTPACGGDDASPGGSSSSSSSGAPASDPGEAAAAACPVQDPLIQGTQWVSCVAGTSLVGVEPFTGKTCTLQFDGEGGVTYSLGVQDVLAAPRASWGASATGTYTNSGSGASRIFLASVSPDLPYVEGQARLLDVNVSIYGVAKSEDLIEVRYLDPANARQTYNCTIAAP